MQVFVMPIGMSIRFLDAYSMVIYTAENRYANNHFVIVDEQERYRGHDAVMQQLFEHPVLLGEFRRNLTTL